MTPITEINITVTDGGEWNQETILKHKLSAEATAFIADEVRRAVVDPSPNKDKGDVGASVTINGTLIASVSDLSWTEYRKVEDRVIAAMVGLRKHSKKGA